MAIIIQLNVTSILIWICGLFFSRLKRYIIIEKKSGKRYVIHFFPSFSHISWIFPLFSNSHKNTTQYFFHFKSQS